MVPTKVNTDKTITPKVPSEFNSKDVKKMEKIVHAKKFMYFSLLELE